MTRRWPIWLIPFFGFILALGLHFWNLGIPAQFIGDEHYFITDARHTLRHEAYLDAHPPLGKLELAAVIHVFGNRPLVWRAWNAVLGALMVPLLWFLGLALTRDRRAAALVMVISLVDGLLLVESRNGMINLPYVAYSFGALAMALLATRSRRSVWWLLGAGLLTGCAVSVKWLGLFPALVGIAIWIWPGWFGQQSPLNRDRCWWWLTALTLFALPVLVYLVVWQVHFWLTGLPSQTVLTNLYLWYYQTHGKIEHLYRLLWWQWPLLTQPFPYAITKTAQTIASIWTLPNPWTWWTGWTAFVWSLWLSYRKPVYRILAALLLASWLPFIFIQRSMFMYHALPFTCGLSLLLGMLGAELWRRHRFLVAGYIVVAVMVFIWFAPWYLNIPTSYRFDEWRRWLPTWTLKQS